MNDDQRIPQLAPGSDPLDLAKSPAEGFLLSRIDGHTPWSVLRQIGGLSPAEAAILLEQPLSKVVMLAVYGWLDKGVFEGRTLDPLSADVAQPYTTKNRKKRRKSASLAGISVAGWEHLFIEEVIRGEGLPLSECDFADALKGAGAERPGQDDLTVAVMRAEPA